MVINIKSELWVEKYRPIKLKDIYGQDIITDQLKSYLTEKNLPHLLFVGNPGVGKTTSAISLAKELYSDLFTDNFLELNASDERGIDTVRIKIKNFSKTAPSSCVSFKLIFLDEADALTNDAQTALRRIMEQYSSNCRFILTCNYFDKIIEPIKSRCAIYNFHSLDSSSMLNYINKILVLEKISIPYNILKSIILKSNGDLRKALTLVQVISINKNFSDCNSLVNLITYDNYTEDLKNIIFNALDGCFKEAYLKVKNLQEKTGLSASEIIHKIYELIYSLEITNDKLPLIISLIGDYDYRITKGSDESIQLETFLAKLSLLKK